MPSKRIPRELRRFLAVVVAAASFLCCVATAGAQPNDSCASPQVLASAGPFPQSGSLDTSAATADPNDPLSPCDFLFLEGATVWFAWTPISDCNATFHTCASDYDTVVTVWTGSCASFVNVTCNDESTVGPCPSSAQSYVRWAARAGTSYVIEVGSYAGSPGGTLRYELDCPECSLAEQEPNDDFASATSISLPASVDCATLSSSSDRDYYSFTVAQSSVVRIATTPGPGQDTRLTLFDASFNQLELNDDCPPSIGGSCVSSGLREGTYFCLVDDTRPGAVLYQLTITGIPCADGTVNSRNGAPAEVLSINGGTRAVAVPQNGAIAVSLGTSPAGPNPGKFGLWIWSGRGVNPLDLSVNGTTLGCVVNPTPLHRGANPQPTFCMESNALPAAVCAGTHRLGGFANAPWVFNRAQGLGRNLEFVMQGILQDNGAGNARRYSVTNAVRLQIQNGNCQAEILDAKQVATTSLGIGHFGADGPRRHQLDGYDHTVNPPTLKNAAAGCFIDTDPDRFYVRVLDAAANTNAAVAETIRVQIKTFDSTNTTDDPTSDIDLVETGPNTGAFLSEAQILTSPSLPNNRDDAFPVYSARAGGLVNDEAANDRTHRAQIGGSVRTTYSPANRAACVANATVCPRGAGAAPHKKLRIRVTVLEEAAGTDVSGDNVINTVLGPVNGVQAIVDAQIARANIAWSQACISVEQVGATRVMAAPVAAGADIIADGTFDDPGDPAAIYGDAGHQAGIDPDIAEVYFVVPINAANAFTNGPTDRIAALGVNTYMFIGVQAGGRGPLDIGYRTLAHEMGHALDNVLPSPDGAQPRYIFYPAGTTRLDDLVETYRRIRQDTVETCRKVRPAGAGNVRNPGNTLLVDP